MKKIVEAFTLIITCVSFSSCKPVSKSISNINISINEEFDNVFIMVDLDTLFNNGYNLGDSLDFKFSNGYEVKNVPFYDGYYGKKGDYMFVTHPSLAYPVLLKEYEMNIFEVASLNEKDTVTITLNKKGFYKDHQDTFSIKYSNDRTKYESDETFANYRCIKVGNIKENTLFRSASPCNNSANRATYASALMEKDKIDYVFDLSNHRKKQENFANNNLTPEYWKTLFNKNQIFDCYVNANFYSEDYYPKIKSLCDGIIDNSGKYLFHCYEGKDRTGFVAILLESLCGASFKEIEFDYFLTYKNYYNITKENDPHKYELYCLNNFYPMTNFIIGEDVNQNATKEALFVGSKNYLKKCGLTNERINVLIDKLTK